MRRLGEQVESAQALKLVPPLALAAPLRLGDEPSNVAGLGVDVARDVHGRERLEGQELLKEGGVTSLAGGLVVSSLQVGNNSRR